MSEHGPAVFVGSYAEGGGQGVWSLKRDANGTCSPTAVFEGAQNVSFADRRLRWPDTFSQGPDGSVYVTSSRIQDMSWFKPENGPRLTTQLWRIDGTAAPR